MNKPLLMFDSHEIGSTRLIRHQSYQRQEMASQAKNCSIVLVTMKNYKS